jgi:hypothetical protein
MRVPSFSEAFMIQTEFKNDKGELEKLSENDPRYWQGVYRYEPYPKLLFKASLQHYQDSDLEHRIVKSEQEHRALSADWCESPDLAREKYDALESDIAKAAAQSAHSDRNMSAGAQAERLAVEQNSDFEHVVDVPAPRKKPGRKPKIKTEPING